MEKNNNNSVLNEAASIANNGIKAASSIAQSSNKDNGEKVKSYVEIILHTSLFFLKIFAYSNKVKKKKQLMTVLNNTLAELKNYVNLGNIVRFDDYKNICDDYVNRIKMEYPDDSKLSDFVLFICGNLDLISEGNLKYGLEKIKEMEFKFFIFHNNIVNNKIQFNDYEIFTNNLFNKLTKELIKLGRVFI